MAHIIIPKRFDLELEAIFHNVLIILYIKGFSKRYRMALKKKHVHVDGVEGVSIYVFLLVGTDSKIYNIIITLV